MTLIDAAFVGKASSIALAALGPAGSISDSATNVQSNYSINLFIPAVNLIFFSLIVVSSFLIDCLYKSSFFCLR
jgi:hypothetical protein